MINYLRCERFDGLLFGTAAAGRWVRVLGLTKWVIPRLLRPSYARQHFLVFTLQLNFCALLDFDFRIGFCLRFKPNYYPKIFKRNYKMKRERRWEVHVGIVVAVNSEFTASKSERKHREAYSLTHFNAKLQVYPSEILCQNRK